MPQAIQEIPETEHSVALATLSERQSPCVFRQLNRHWPAVSSSQDICTWLEELRHSSVDAPVTVMHSVASNEGRFFYTDDLTRFNFTRERMSFHRFLNALKSAAQGQPSDAMYLGSVAMSYIAPRFAQLNSVKEMQDAPINSLWIGTRSRIATHYDSTHNLACVMAGERRFTLFPPAQHANLYIGPLDNTPAGQPVSLVDVRAPDYTRFPRYKEAEKVALEATLAPGDAVFIPGMWWHSVEGLSAVNAMQNYWWRDVSAFHGAPMDALFHAVLAIRDLPETQRQYWQELFATYVFNANEQHHIPDAARGILNRMDEDSARRLRAQIMQRLNR
ncbi:cupin-like domain-containing protein [Alteromonas oceanisediminis]|uniref:cupin-like domain-containing protein n=1 Tax=Alteromonas oceanisediminis TaxID=2836180 RepID=UPI001BDACD76|nr:cupin-like domain-containing protein [Alteromonas oceanisediminis]MBT0587411.1 cupin-like domain-containing protein [Alteromonas oceanisediminis]